MSCCHGVGENIRTVASLEIASTPREACPPTTIWRCQGGQCSPARVRSTEVRTSPRIRGNGKLRFLTPVECERLDGFPDGWTEGMSDKRRRFMMGNALVCGIVRRLGDRISEIMDREKQGSEAEWGSAIAGPFSVRKRKRFPGREGRGTCKSPSPKGIRHCNHTGCRENPQAKTGAACARVPSSDASVRRRCRRRKPWVGCRIQGRSPQASERSDARTMRAKRGLGRAASSPRRVTIPFRFWDWTFGRLVDVGVGRAKPMALRPLPSMRGSGFHGELTC